MLFPLNEGGGFYNRESPAQKLGHQHSKCSLRSGWHNSVTKESEFVGAIVTGDVQLGIVHPMGKPISVSTQRGFNLPFDFVFI